MPHAEKDTAPHTNGEMSNNTPVTNGDGPHSKVLSVCTHPTPMPLHRINVPLAALPKHTIPRLPLQWKGTQQLTPHPASALLPRSPRLFRSLQVAPLWRTIPCPYQRVLPALRRPAAPLPANALLLPVTVPQPRRRARRQRPQQGRRPLPHCEGRYLKAQADCIRLRFASAADCRQGQGVRLRHMAG